MLTNNHTTDLAKVCSICSELKSIDLFYKVGNQCKKCRYLNCRTYNANNREKVRTQQKIQRSRESFKERRRAYRKTLKTYNYHKQRKAKDPSYKLLCSLRNRIDKVLKNIYNGKVVRTTKVTFGCSTEEVVKHIESQFKEGMSWKNHGLYTWHIDHIKPLSSFNLLDPEEVKRANHYTNLQPLWAKDNLSKGATH